MSGTSLGTVSNAAGARHPVISPLDVPISSRYLCLNVKRLADQFRVRVNVEKRVSKFFSFN